MTLVFFVRVLWSVSRGMYNSTWMKVCIHLINFDSWSPSCLFATPDISLVVCSRRFSSVVIAYVLQPFSWILSPSTLSVEDAGDLPCVLSSICGVFWAFSHLLPDMYSNSSDFSGEYPSPLGSTYGSTTSMPVFKVPWIWLSLPPVTRSGSRPNSCYGVGFRSYSILPVVLS